MAVLIVASSFVNLIFCFIVYITVYQSLQAKGCHLR